MALLIVLLLGQVPQTLAQEGTVYFTNPGEGATVAGLVTITGAASFPDFLKYEIFLKPGKGDLLWVATTYAPVINGNLARFDTRTYQNGSYRLILRQVGSNSNYTDYEGPMILVDNPQGAPLPHPEIEPSYLYPPEKYGLVRVKNCSGVGLEFDYTSPEGFRSSGNLWLMAKAQDTTYCPFEDFVVIPGEYRGTATGQGEKAYSYTFKAEVGQVYELIYNGEGAGRNQFLVNYVQPDERASSDKAGVPGSIPIGEPAKVSAPAAPAESVPAQNKAILPATGDDGGSQLFFVVVGISLVVLVLLGGAVATALVANRKGLLG